ncbi:MAG: DUF3293 domain-containing protein [Xanthomonadales bacterium]|nr:DUF3293 domain-containing protein [Xanthomonadales bacterium]
MDEALLAQYRASTYLVCVDRVRWPAIVIEQALPATLQALVGTQPWAFITAWNPGSIRRADEPNQAAQRKLLGELPRNTLSLPAIGIGPDGWYEPSLFVVGPEFAALDALATAFRQNAYLRGRGADHASLYVVRP